MSVNHNSNKVSNMALNKRKRKLKFRCWHRGSREADLLLGNFVDKYLPDMDISDVEKLESIADSSDQEIWGWVTGNIPIPAGISFTMVDSLKSIYTQVSSR